MGKKHTPESIEKCRQAKLGDKNPMYGISPSLETRMKQSSVLKGRYTGPESSQWQGDNIKYSSLHQWVRKHLPQSETCELCHEVPPRDLANMTGNYNREFHNWKYLCRKCHMASDGRKGKVYRTHEERSASAVKSWETRRKNRCLKK